MLVYNPDRLCRDDLRGLENLIDALNANDVAVATVRSGEFDLSTAHGRPRPGWPGCGPGSSRRRCPSGSTDKHVELADAGKPNGGRRPDGLRERPGDGRESEATIVREIIDRVAAGETLTRIADDLNARGVPTSTGSRWAIWTVRRIALNGRYAGRRIHKGVDVGAADWPAHRRRGDMASCRGPAQRSEPAATPLGPPLPARRGPHRLRQVRAAAALQAASRPSGKVPVYACRPTTQGGCGGVTVRADSSRNSSPRR